MRGYPGLLLSAMLIFEACIARTPSSQAPRATASLPSMPIFYTPTPIPTLGGETTWQEPLAQRSVILERPSPSGGIDLYLLSPDGRPPIRLAHLSEDVFQARASPDGRWLAVQTRPHEGVGRDVLYLLSLLDLRFHPVIQNSWITSLAWAPSGDALAFSQWTDGPVRIMLYDLIRQQTSLLVEERDSGPWSVEGWVGKQKLVLSRLRGGGLMIDQIALLDLQTRRLEILYTDPTAHTTMASVSPDGRTILIGQAESLPALSIQVLRLDLADRHLTPLVKREDPEAMMLTVPVWSPSGTRVAFVAAAGYAPGSSEKGGGKEVPQAQRVVILDVQNGHTSRVVEVPSPNPSIQVLAWLSEEVLLITTLEEQLNDLVLYSIRTDGTGKQRILDLGGGRFLTTLPHYLPRDDFNRPNGPLGPH